MNGVSPEAVDGISIAYIDTRATPSQLVEVSIEAAVVLDNVDATAFNADEAAQTQFKKAIVRTGAHEYLRRRRRRSRLGFHAGCSGGRRHVDESDHGPLRQGNGAPAPGDVGLDLGPHHRLRWQHTGGCRRVE